MKNKMSRSRNTANQIKYPYKSLSPFTHYSEQDVSGQLKRSYQANEENEWLIEYESIYLSYRIEK